MISEWWGIGLALGDVLGHWFAGSKYRWVWLWFIGVELGWAAYAHITDQAGFYLFPILHLVVFLRNYRKWGTQHEHAHGHPHEMV